MGLEAYTVLLTPRSSSPLVIGHYAASIQSLVSEMQREWPDIHRDEEEHLCQPYPPQREEAFLFYETRLGLFQIMLTPHREGVTASVRFAYCNPRSVYRPFTSVIAWLMEQYGMCGYTMASDRSQELNDPYAVLTVLTPSMDYNRHLWQLDAGTSEEAILSPGRAIERFILPRCLSAAPALSVQT